MTFWRADTNPNSSTSPEQSLDEKMPILAKVYLVEGGTNQSYLPSPLCATLVLNLVLISGIAQALEILQTFIICQKGRSWYPWCIFLPWRLLSNKYGMLTTNNE